MLKKIILVFLTVFMFSNICSAALVSTVWDPKNNIRYYVDYCSVECDIYNPPEYRLHCNVILKTLDTDEYISEETHYYRYDYINQDIFFVTYENGIETEIDASTNSLYDNTGRNIFLTAYNQFFPNKYKHKDC